MYDMYPWNDPDSGADHHQDDSRVVPADPPAPAVRAVQFALDRRDNGGDALDAAGRPMSQPPAEPAAGRTRQ